MITVPYDVRLYLAALQEAFYTCMALSLMWSLDVSDSVVMWHLTD